MSYEKVEDLPIKISKYRVVLGKLQHLILKKPKYDLKLWIMHIGFIFTS